jgi:DMSO/TMAO reductase YedYZ heme-binding membrane subunit
MSDRYPPGPSFARTRKATPMATPDEEPARTPSRRAPVALAVPIVLGGVLAAVLTVPASGVVLRLRDLLEYVAGVFTLLALTEVVVSGVAAAERVVPTQARIVLQSAHRATGLLAVGFLAAHVTLKIAEAHAGALDAVVPFMGHHGRAGYIGLGTIASDLLVLVLVTGMMRPWFTAGRRPWLWRPIHTLSYVAWPLAVLHGLLAGRAPKGWVVVSYVVAATVVVLAVASRLPRLVMERRAVPARVPGRDARVPVPEVPLPGEQDDESPAAHAAGRPGDRR